MFKLLASASVAFVAVSGVAGYLVPRRDAPAGWATDYLEPYQTYHTRYLALGCQSQHGKAFFDECCHPLLANESLSSRPAECTPSASASSSASAAEPTSTVATPGDDDDDDCDDESSSAAPSSTAAPASSSSSAQSSATSAPVNVAPAAPVNVAPAPVVSSSSAAPSPSSTKASPTPKATPSSTHSSAPAATSAASSSSGLITGGFATFFYQNGVAGACGTVHSDNDLIAAIDQDRYGNSGVQSSLCGKKVQITNPANGKSVTVTIADDCPTCKNSDSIDLSYGAFTSIATEAEGMVNIDWKFIN